MRLNPNLKSGLPEFWQMRISRLRLCAGLGHHRDRPYPTNKRRFSIANLSFRLVLALALVVGGAPNCLVHAHQSDALHHAHETAYDAHTSHTDSHHDRALAAAADLDQSDPIGSEGGYVSLPHGHACYAPRALVPVALAVLRLTCQDNYGCRRPSPRHLWARVLPELRSPIA